MLLEHLQKTLILNQDYILTVAGTASKRYKFFKIKKSNGTKRAIFHPAKELKALQRVIHEDFLIHLPIHESATAYYQGASTKKNAEIHANSKFLLRMDFKNFFESIKTADIYRFIEESKHLIGEDWNTKDTELFVNLVCFNKGLTIGSVTSPMLSNAICYELDKKISSLCESEDILYTRYSDDMFFSTNEEDKLFEISKKIKTIVRSLNYPKSLWVNFNKTRHSSKKHRMMVTGLVLTNDGRISIGRNKKREIRGLIFKWDGLSSREKKYLVGYLSYCRSVEPTFINNLYVKYGAEIMGKIEKYKEPLIGN